MQRLGEWIFSCRRGLLERRLKLDYAFTTKSSSLPPTCNPTPKPFLSPNDSAIAKTGASGHYLTPHAPCANVNPSALQSLVGPAGGPPHRSSVSCGLILSSLPTTSVHIMPKFHHNLMGIGPLCNRSFHVIFEETAVTVFSKDNTLLLKGYLKQSGSKLWHFSLLPNNIVLQQCPTGPIALNANDLPSVRTLVQYLHAVSGFPVKSTCLTDINAGNYASWPGLTSANVYKYFPVPIENLQGHLKQYKQGVLSTKSTTPPEPTAPPHPATKTKERYVQIEPISKLYTNDMDCFPVRSCSGNYFIMLAYHVESNVILVEPFQSRHDRHRLATANCIMFRLQKNVHKVDLQILYNECSTA